MDNELNNPLLSNDFLGSFDGTVDLDALAGFQSGINPEENEFTALHTNHRGYIGDDGQIYRKEIYYNKETDEFTREYTDERLYFWTPPQELGDRGLNENEGAALAGRDKFGAAGLYTESEIKAAWDADQGMGYLKEANPDLTWESYWDFVQKTTELFTDPEYDDRTDGNMVAGNFQDSPEYMALLEESGIKTQYVNSDGDVFNWNGTGYSKDFKVDDSIDIGVINSVALGLIGGVVAGPLIAQALTPALGAAGATAASSAIVSTASQYMTTGEIDWGQALVSAATAYGGAKLGDALKGSGALGEIGEKVSNVTNKFEELISTGNSIADAAIKAGGIDMLMQFVTTGEVDPVQAAISAIIAGGTEGFNQYRDALSATDADADAFMQDLAENEEFTQAAINADLKDPFLNPNYETVGDGVVVNTATGIVYGVTSGDELGNMSDLDTNGDGMLSGNDLEYVNVTTQKLGSDLGYKMGDTVYVDANNNPVDPKMVKFGPDGYTYNGEPVTGKPYNEVYGGDKGGLKWEFGLNEDGSVSTTDGAIYYENGELAYEKIGGQWQDSQGNIIDDPAKVDELTMIAAKAIDEPLESVQYFDQSGNPINYKYPPADLKDNFEQGQFSGLIFGPNGKIYEVWYDPITNTEYVKAQGTTEITAIRTPENPPKPVEPSTANDNQGADQTNQDSTAAGQGSGPTQATGGTSGNAGESGGATGGAPIGGQSGASGIGSGGGFIPSAGSGTDTTGTQTTGDSTSQGTQVSTTNTAGTGNGTSGTAAGTGQNGQTGASSGTASGTADTGSGVGAATGTDQSIDLGFGVSFGEDSGTGGLTGGGSGEETGGGTGDSPGTGTGSGGTGLGTGSSGGAISGMGKPASFQGMLAGLSYEPQPVPGIMPTPKIDYVVDLEQLIARQLQRRGMFT